MSTDSAKVLVPVPPNSSSFCSEHVHLTRSGEIIPHSPSTGTLGFGSAIFVSWTTNQVLSHPSLRVPMDLENAEIKLMKRIWPVKLSIFSQAVHFSEVEKVNLRLMIIEVMTITLREDFDFTARPSLRQAKDQRWSLSAQLQTNISRETSAG